MDLVPPSAHREGVSTYEQVGARSDGVAFVLIPRSFLWHEIIVVMGVAASAARATYRVLICYKPPRAPKPRPQSAPSHASVDDEQQSTILAEYEMIQNRAKAYRPDPRSLRREVRRQDAIRRIRNALVESIPNKTQRARYMERYFAQRNGDESIMWEGGFGEGGVPRVKRDTRVNPQFHKNVPTSPGTNVNSRIVSLDHLPPGVLDSFDFRDVAMGRSVELSERKGLVPGFGDGLQDWIDVETDSDDEFTERFNDDDRSTSISRSEPPPPKTLARRRLDFDGKASQYPAGRGRTRWREYCKEEDSKIVDLAAFFLSEREEKITMMRAYYRHSLGPGFEDEYEPPPLPKWLLSPGDTEYTKKHAPWRRGGDYAYDLDENDENLDSTFLKNREKRKVLRRMDDGLQQRTVNWRASVDLREFVVNRELDRQSAGDKVWDEGKGIELAAARDGTMFLGDDKNTDLSSNPVRHLDNFPTRSHIAGSPAYHSALEKGGLEPSRVVANVLRDVRGVNHEKRDVRLANDAARRKIRRHEEKLFEKARLKKLVKAETRKLRKAAAAAAAKARALEDAPPRWRRMKAVGKFIRKKTMSSKGGEKTEAK